MTGGVWTDTVQRALDRAAAERARHEWLWAMTREQRVAAFFRDELTFEDCLAWARRFPSEPPIGPSGEWLFIEVTTPEVADAPARLPVRTSRGLGLER